MMEKRILSWLLAACVCAGSQGTPAGEARAAGPAAAATASETAAEAPGAAGDESGREGPAGPDALLATGSDAADTGIGGQAPPPANSGMDAAGNPQQSGAGEDGPPLEGAEGEAVGDAPALQGKEGLLSLYEKIQGETPDVDYREHVGLLRAESLAEAEAAAQRYQAELQEWMPGMAVLGFPGTYADRLWYAIHTEGDFPALYPNYKHGREEIPEAEPGSPDGGPGQGTQSRMAAPPDGGKGSARETGVTVKNVRVNDPKLGQQWQHSFLHTAAVWGITMGEGVTVAVLDSGVDEDHPDLKNNLIASYDCYMGYDGGSYTDDKNGHGTMVAGLIAAEADNGIGIAGIAPKAKLISCRVANRNGYFYDDTIYKGIITAVDAGADVINLSVAFSVETQWLQRGVEYAVEHGTVIVAAAGNDKSSSAHYPAALEGVIGTGALDAGGNRMPYSNYGAWVDLMAPGDELLSTKMGGGYGYGGATSGAAGIMSGIVALALGANPDLISRDDSTVVEEIQHMLYSSARPETPALYYGKGIADIYHMLGIVGSYDHQIDYVLNGGTNPSGNPNFYNRGTTVTLKSPIRADYAFGGWYLDEKLTRKVTSISQRDCTLYAKWAPVRYPITYNLDGGTKPAGLPSVYTVEEEVTLPEPTRKGYTFAGWYADKELTVKVEGPHIPKGSSKAKRFYAAWERQGITLEGLKPLGDSLTVSSEAEKAIGFRMEFSDSYQKGSLRVEVRKETEAAGTLKAEITVNGSGEGTLKLASPALKDYQAAGYTVEILCDTAKKSDASLYKLKVTVNDFYEASLKLKQTVKTLYTRQEGVDITVASPVFSPRTTRRKVIWKSENPDILQVNEDTGAVTGVFAPGTADITAMADAPEWMPASKASIKVVVKRGIESIRVIGCGEWFITKGKASSFGIQASINDGLTKPALARLKYELVEAPAGVSIDSGKGTVKISKDVDLGASSQATVTVRILAGDYSTNTVKEEFSILLKDSSLAKQAPSEIYAGDGDGTPAASGEKASVNAGQINGKTLLVKDGSGDLIPPEKLLFSSSNKKLIQVSESGAITAQGAGKVRLTAKMNDGTGKSISWDLTLQYARAEDVRILLDAKEPAAGEVQFQKDASQGGSTSEIRIQVKEGGAYKDLSEAGLAYNLKASVANASVVRQMENGILQAAFRANSTDKKKSSIRVTDQEAKKDYTATVEVHGNGSANLPALLSKDSSDYVLYRGLKGAQKLSIRYKSQSVHYAGLSLTANPAAYWGADPGYRAAYSQILAGTGTGYRAATVKDGQAEVAVEIPSAEKLLPGKYKLDVVFCENGLPSSMTSKVKTITVTVKDLPTLKIRQKTYSLSAYGVYKQPLYFDADSSGVEIERIELYNSNINGNVNRFQDFFGVAKVGDAFYLYIRTADKFAPNDRNLKGYAAVYLAGSDTPCYQQIAVKVLDDTKQYRFAKDTYRAIPLDGARTFELNLGVAYRGERRGIVAMSKAGGNAQFTITEGKQPGEGPRLHGSDMADGLYELSLSVLPKGTVYDFLTGTLGEQADAGAFQIPLPAKVEIGGAEGLQKAVKQVRKTDAISDLCYIKFTANADNLLPVSCGLDPGSEDIGLFGFGEGSIKAVQLVGSAQDFSVLAQLNMMKLPSWKKGRKLKVRFQIKLQDTYSGRTEEVTVPVSLQLGGCPAPYPKYRGSRIVIYEDKAGRLRKVAPDSVLPGTNYAYYTLERDKDYKIFQDKGGEYQGASSDIRFIYERISGGGGDSPCGRLGEEALRDVKGGVITGIRKFAGLTVFEPELAEIAFR